MSSLSVNMQFFANGQVLDPSRLGLFDIVDRGKLVEVVSVRHLALSPISGFWAFNGRDYVNNPAETMRPYPSLGGEIGLLYADGHVETLSDEELQEQAPGTLFRDQ